MTAHQLKLFAGHVAMIAREHVGSKFALSLHTLSHVDIFIRDEANVIYNGNNCGNRHGAIQQYAYDVAQAFGLDQE
jgi:hypothetical protein